MKLKFILSLLTGLSIVFISCNDDELLSFDNSLFSDIECGHEGPMTRTEAIQLVLSRGIGYGYNGIDGESCNVMDVRSQVLDPDGIRAMNVDFRINEVYSPQVSYNTATAYSLNELLQKLYFGGGLNAEAAIAFKGSVRGTLQLYTKAKTNSFYCRTSALLSGFNASVDAPSVSALVKDHPEVLTKNFRNAVARLGDEPTKMQMDSLIRQYGTHVVTKCQMGGKLELDIRLEKDTIATLEQQHAIAEVSLLSLYDHSTLSENDYRDLKIINSGDSHLTVRGGDTRELDFSVFNFKWGENNAKMDAIGKWMGTIGITEDQQQYLELIDMQMTPIWRFVPNKQVAKMLEAHILGTADVLLDIYGYQNFVNTAFHIPPLNTYQGQEIMENQVKNVYNILVGGRYVATYCREWVDIIDINEPVWVAYPVYNQQVNTATGLCIHNGKAYRVGWRFGEYYVEEIGETDSKTVYMTLGCLYPESTEGVDYQEGKLCVGYEWPSSINKEGKLNTDNPIYLPYKKNDDFYLLKIDGEEQSGNLNGLPNWIFDEKQNRMVRSKDYIYYCNSQEMAYVENHTNVLEYIDLRRLTEDIVITKDVTVSHTTSHKLTIADGVTLTLNNAVINNQIKCEGNAVIELADGSKNSVTATDVPAIELGEKGTTFIIYGTDKSSLTVKSSDAAGIGSAFAKACGSIAIYGGVITATGGYQSAGIGSSRLGKCENIDIFGGMVCATGGKSGGAGIGSGAYASCGDIEISRAYVYAKGRQGGMGIGDGNIGRCGYIRIYDNVEEVVAVACDFDCPSSIASHLETVKIRDGANVKDVLHVNLDQQTSDIILERHCLLSGTTNHKVTIKGVADVFMEDAHVKNQLCCSGDITIRLEDGTCNSVECGDDDEPGIKVDMLCKLRIKGEAGQLSVKSKGTGIGGKSQDVGGDVTIESGEVNIVAEGEGCAGIGAGKAGACNDIVISGGTITVIGGEEAAAIGSGARSACGYIKIYGGKVIANTGVKGAAIGTGSGSYCADITITGGIVNATGGTYGAGIGGGADGLCGNINISGGDVIAQGGDGNDEQGGGVGIGGGYNCEKINISSGKIIAIGGIKGGAGIGSGSGANHICGKISLTGGYIQALGHDGGAGIGSSNDNSSCGDIVIRNTVDEVYAIAKRGMNAQAIGAGANGSTSGRITIDEDANVVSDYE